MIIMCMYTRMDIFVVLFFFGSVLDMLADKKTRDRAVEIFNGRISSFSNHGIGTCF